MSGDKNYGISQTEAGKWLESINPENLYVVAGDTMYRKDMPALLGPSILTHSVYSDGGKNWGFTLCRVSAEKPENLQGLGLFKYVPAEDITLATLFHLLALPLGYPELDKELGVEVSKLPSGSLMAYPDRKLMHVLPWFFVLNSEDTDTFKRDISDIFKGSEWEHEALEKLFGARKFDDWDSVAWEYPTEVFNVA